MALMAQRWRGRPQIWGFWLVTTVHFIVAFYYFSIVKLDIQWVTWDELWQTLPLKLIQTDLLRSLYYFHAQPPLFNLFGAFFIRLFYPHHLQALYAAHIVLGALLAGMVYRILWSLTHHMWLALVGGLLLALNPSLFLFEAYPLYTLLTAFWVTLSVFCLVLYQENGRIWLLPAFILVLNLLILTRSLYHLLILLVAVPLAMVWAHQQWQRILPPILMICLLSTAWYGKNLVEFGFFGESSWTGIGLWKIVGAGYSNEQLQDFVQRGLVAEPVMTLKEFSVPSQFEPYGFTTRSDIPALAQDDFNNINIQAIAAMYQQSAVNMLKEEPEHYALNVILAYMVYTSPPTRFYHLAKNRTQMGVHERVMSQYLLGQRFIQQVIPVQDKTIGSIMSILLPANMLFYGLWLWKQNKLSPQKWLAYVRLDGVMVFMVFLIAYTTLVGVTLEYIENARFQFLVEQLIWVFILVTLYRILTDFRIHSSSQT